MTNTQTQKQSVEVGQSSATPEVAEERIEGLDLANLALQAALDKKALEPVLLDVSKLCSYTEYLLVVSGRSDRQVAAITGGIRDALRLKGRRPLGAEGEGQWSLLDFGDVVVHVFRHPVRDFYDLEGLWQEAPRVEIEIPSENRVDLEDMY